MRVRLAISVGMLLVGCGGRSAPSPSAPVTVPAPAAASAPASNEQAARDLFDSLVAIARGERPGQIADHVTPDVADHASQLAMILEEIHCKATPEVSSGPSPFPHRDPAEQSLVLTMSCMNSDSIHRDDVTVEPTHQRTMLLFVRSTSGLRVATWIQIH